MAPAGAVIPSGCKASSVAGATISWYPGQPASMSTLKVACRFDAATGSSMVSAKFTIHDAGVAVYHNGAARTVTGNASTIGNAATTIQLTSCAGITGWINHPITRVPVVTPAVADTVVLAPRTFAKTISATCLVTLNQPTITTPGPNAAIPIPGGSSFKIDNAIARSVADGVTNGTTTITSATANFTSADVGLSVGGTEVPDNTTIASVTPPSTAVLNNATNGAGSTGNVLTFGGSLLVTTTRTFNDGAITNATTITSAVGKFKAEDVGLPVYGTGIPVGTYVTGFTAGSLTTTGGMTPAAGPLSITLGDPSVTAPSSSDTVAEEGVQLDLDPSLVAGLDDCANDTPEGFAVAAKWNNPGSFGGAGLPNIQPTGTKAIGQIFFDTSAADFSGFVIERGVLAAGDPNGAAHYDIVFPFVPTGLALCASATSPGLGYALTVLATTLSQAQLPAGNGRPGTSQFRSLKPSATGGYTDSVTLKSDDPGVTYTPTSEFTRLCIYPAGPATVSFQCGN